MMIGQRPARGFDPYMPQQQPMFDMDVPDVAPIPMQAPAKPKPNWMGILADALAGAAGRPAMYAQQQYQQRAEQSALERGEEQYQRRRMDNREDRIWERDNTPKSPYRWESNDGSLMEMGQDGNPRLVYQDPTPKEKWVFDPVRGYVNINAGSAAPTAPVGRLTPLGGQTPPASGNFPFGSPLDPNLGRY